MTTNFQGSFSRAWIGVLEEHFLEINKLKKRQAPVSIALILLIERASLVCWGYDLWTCTPPFSSEHVSPTRKWTEFSWTFSRGSRCQAPSFSRWFSREWVERPLCANIKGDLNLMSVFAEPIPFRSGTSNPTIVSSQWTATASKPLAWRRWLLTTDTWSCASSDPFSRPRFFVG